MGRKISCAELSVNVCCFNNFNYIWDFYSEGGTENLLKIIKWDVINLCESTSLSLSQTKYACSVCKKNAYYYLNSNTASSESDASNKIKRLSISRPGERGAERSLARVHILAQFVNNVLVLQILKRTKNHNAHISY